MALVQLHGGGGRDLRRRPGACIVADGARAPFDGIWVVAAGPLMRLRGLARRRPDRTVMVFPRCRDVHTLTMRHPLDIAFVDRRDRVVEVHRQVQPGSRLRSTRAHAVIERFARPGPWFMRGDVVRVGARPGGRRRRRTEGLRGGIPRGPVRRRKQ